MAKGLGETSADFDLWNLRGYACNISLLLPHFLSGSEGKNYGLIIIDPVYKILGDRVENVAGDVADLLNEIEKLAIKTGAAVVFGAHFSKGNQSKKESIDRIGDSGVFSRDPDSILTLTPHKEEDCFTVDLVLRNLPPQDAFVVRREHPLMVRDYTKNSDDLKRAAGRFYEGREK